MFPFNLFVRIDRLKSQKYEIEYKINFHSNIDSGGNKIIYIENWQSKFSDVNKNKTQKT